MSTLDKSTPTKLENGLNKDSNFLVSGDASFVLNGIRNEKFSEYQSEPGNATFYSLPTGYKLVGSIYGTDNKVYLFSTNNVLSEIGVQRSDNYQTLVNANLGFNQNNPITGEYRVRNYCDPIIYWCDNLNSDRWFDENNPNLFKDTGGNWVIDKFNFKPNINIPTIDLVSVNDNGGNLGIGSYYFQLELLDKNENIIYKSDITPQTIIYDNSTSEGFVNIDGAVNIANYDAMSGGVPPTTKSISLRFDNIDTNFKYIRVKVAYQNGSNQIMQAHVVGNLIPIEQNFQYNWTYTGYNPSNGDFAIDYTELLVDNIKYDSSYVMEQVQNRLVRANLKQDNKDYSTYQSFASATTSKWVASESLANDQTSLGNPKNPKTYWYKTNFQGDEVYAFGIQYLHKNGEWSPIFHIPGRASEPSDNALLTVVANNVVLNPGEIWLSDVEHLNETDFQFWNTGYLGSFVKRWKVFNTANITSSSTVTHPYNWKGLFGYHEANLNYPNIVDCNNNLVWGDGITTSTKIRYHKFPDRSLITHLNGDAGEYIVPLGVEFTVSAYPNSEVVGHRFCHATRTEGNQTVTDSGWSYAQTPSELTNELNITGFYSSILSDKSVYLSPEINYNNAVTSANYVKHNKVFRLDTNTINSVADATKFTSINDNTINNAIVYTDTIKQQNTVRKNYKINKQVFLPAGSSIDESLTGFQINNKDVLTDASLLITNSNIENYSSYNTGQSASTFLIAPGSYFIKGNIAYVYKKLQNDPYSNLLNLKYNYLNFNPIYGAGVDELYNGDSLLIENNLFRLAQYTMYVFNEDTTENDFYYVLIDKMWCESNLNTSLRYQGLDESFTYFKRGDTDLKAVKHFTNVIEGSGDSFKLEFKPLDNWYSDYYAINRDFNLQKNDKTKLSLPNSFNYCSKCRGLYSNRIVFSPKSFDEENFDLYRVTLNDDYIDIPGHRGAITGLQYKNNYLIVRTTETTFVLRPNPQSINTNDSAIYLSTGEFLGLVPEEIAQSDVGFAGMQSKMSEVNTPYGLYWVDQKRGQVFRFNSQLEEISSPEFKMNQWFKENLPSELDNAFLKVYNKHYPFNNNTINFDAIGVHLFYDPRYKRVFVSKKDYNLNTLGTTFGYNFTTNTFYNIATPATTLRRWNPIFFENKSFNISFGIDYNRWISWHSYIPYNAFSDENHYYTLDDDVSRLNKPFKHLHKGSYQTFYTVKKPFIIEYMVSDHNTDNLSAIHYNAYATTYDISTDTFIPVEKTFNKIMCYNTYQNTGLLNLTLDNQHTNPYTNVTQLANTKSVIKTDNNFKVSGLYDMSINTVNLSKDWSLIQNDYYIDVVPFNIDFNKSQYNWSKLKDKFVNVRLYYYPDNTDSKQLINLIQTQESYSVR